MRRVTISDMVTRATQKAEIELLRSKERKEIKRFLSLGDVLISTYQIVNPSEPVESERDLLSDLVSMHESY